MSTANRQGVFACPVTEETCARQVECQLCDSNKVLSTPVTPQTDGSSPPSLFVSLSCSDLEACEPGWKKFQGFCYRHFTKRQSWEAAEQHCRMCGGHLLSVMTPEEQDYINGKAPEEHDSLTSLKSSDFISWM